MTSIWIVLAFVAIGVMVTLSVGFSTAFLKFAYPSEYERADRDVSTGFLAFFLSFIGVFLIGVATPPSSVVWALPAVAYALSLFFGTLFFLKRIDESGSEDS